MAAFDLLLCGLILASAALALLGRELLTAIAFFVIYGMLVALAWVVLEAPDIALAEAAIGAGLTGVLLIGAWQTLSASGALRDDVTAALPARIGAAIGCFGFAGLIGTAVIARPGTGGLTEAVAANQNALQVDNPVTAVLLGFRAYDTLLETIVLTVALVAVWSLTPGRLWGGIPRPKQTVRPGGVLTSFARLLIAPALMIGLYLVWAGSDGHGGAFQGATLLAAVWTLGVLAGVQDEPGVTARLVRAVVVAGPLVFVAFGLAGTVLGTPLAFPQAHAKPMIVGLELVLTLSIAAMLAMLLAGPARRTS